MGTLALPRGLVRASWLFSSHHCEHMHVCSRSFVQPWSLSKCFRTVRDLPQRGKECPRNQKNGQFVESSFSYKSWSSSRHELPLSLEAHLSVSFSTLPLHDPCLPVPLNSVEFLDSCQISRDHSRRKPQRESKGRALASGMPWAQSECLLASRSRFQICPACTVSKYQIYSVHVCCRPKKNVIYFSANFKALLVHENTSRCSIEKGFTAFLTHL